VSGSRSETWFVLQSGPGSPAYNMAVDELLLETAADRGVPLLRFYGWTQPAATFGYFQRLRDVERSTTLRPLMRRPTAGGIVPHDLDWTYSLTFPATHPWWSLDARESYRRLHLWVQVSLDCFRLVTTLANEAQKLDPLQCFAGPDALDVLVEGGGKIAGAAQRRNKHGLLIQGSLQMGPDLDRTRWERSMLDTAHERWGLNWEPWSPSADWATQAQSRSESKFMSESYLRRR